MGRCRFFFPLACSLVINRCLTALYSIVPSLSSTGGASDLTRWVIPEIEDPFMSSRPQPADGWPAPLPFACSQCPFSHAEGLPCPQLCTSPFDCRFKIPPTHEWACEGCARALWRAAGPPLPPPSPPSLEFVLGEISYALNTMLRASPFLIFSISEY